MHYHLCLRQLMDIILIKFNTAYIITLNSEVHLISSCYLHTPPELLELLHFLNQNCLREV